MSDLQKIIEEYPKDYCDYLEAAYGEGMLSEGGLAAIENMFSQENLLNKNIIDIGFGLGGVASYLAEKYHANITGLEINPWMVKEATKRIRDELKTKLTFQQYNPYEKINFKDNTMDIVYSKGVLTHLDNKKILFSEIFRVLKPGGVLIIDDWLSQTKDQWGKKLQAMCQKENLTLYAETELNYKKLLENAGFKNIQMRDENKNYVHYNQNIVDNLKKLKMTSIKNKIFDKFCLDKAIESYQQIVDSIETNELLIRWFRGIK